MRPSNNYIDVTFICGFATINALGSIIELLHYTLAWDEVKVAQYQKAVASLKTPALGFSGSAGTVDVVLADIRMYPSPYLIKYH